MLTIYGDHDAVKPDDLANLIEVGSYEVIICDDPYILSKLIIRCYEQPCVKEGILIGKSYCFPKVYYYYMDVSYILLHQVNISKSTLCLFTREFRPGIGYKSLLYYAKEGGTDITISSNLSTKTIRITLIDPSIVVHYGLNRVVFLVEGFKIIHTRLTYTEVQ